MSTIELTIRIPDTVEELLALTGPAPDNHHTLRVEHYANGWWKGRRKLAEGQTRITQGTPGETTHHSVDCPVTATGKAVTFDIYYDDNRLTNTTGIYDDGPARVRPGDLIRFIAQITWNP